METVNLICIGCPMGCPMTVTLENGVVTSVVGNTCKRGDIYARKEVTAPTRIVTSTVRIANSRVGAVTVPCKTKTDVPKGKIFAVMQALTGVTVPAPAAQTQPEGREPERRDLVPVQPHELRELGPHPVEPAGGGGCRAGDGNGDGESRARATAGAREEGGMVGGREGRGGGDGRGWERRGEERERDAEEGGREPRLRGRRGHPGGEPAGGRARW